VSCDSSVCMGLEKESVCVCLMFIFVKLFVHSQLFSSRIRKKRERECVFVLFLCNFNVFSAIFMDFFLGACILYVSGHTV
jgi:hypothetical protein